MVKQTIGRAAKVRMPVGKMLKKNWLLLLMLTPASLFALVFSYAPMSGIVLAFKNFQYAGGIFGSPWVGIQNFLFLRMSGKLGIITRNTFLYNLAFLVLGLVFEVGFAIILSEIAGKRFKKASQSMMFLPYFVSWVVVGAVMYNVFNFERGVVNNLLRGLGVPPFDLYNQPGAWPIVIIVLRLWKQTGYGSVVYLAAITGLDQEMFEAADIDGANIWQKIRNITVPALYPTMMILLLLGIGNIFRGDFGLFYQTVKSNAKILPTTDIIDTFVFRALMSTGDVGMAAAAGLFQSMLCFLTIMGANGLVKKLRPDYSLF